MNSEKWEFYDKVYHPQTGGPPNGTIFGQAFAAFKQGKFDPKKSMDLLQRELKRKRASDPNTTPDWKGKCEVCGASPIVPCTGMCGPCTFGEAETAGGNW